MPDRRQVSLQPAWVLHHRPWRDSSQLAEIFTRDHGRVGLISRGSRRVRGGRHLALQPFQPLLVSWSARGELGTLTGAEPAGPPLNPAGQRLMSLFYMNELLLRLLERDDAHPGLFETYGEAAQAIADGADEAAVLRVFEKRLLESLGYGLNLETEGEGDRVLEPEGRYEYHAEAGARRVADERRGEWIFPGASLLALAREDLSSLEARQDARRLLQRTLALYLGDRPLKSREVLRAMRRRPGA